MKSIIIMMMIILLSSNIDSDINNNYNSKKSILLPPHKQSLKLMINILRDQVKEESVLTVPDNRELKHAMFLSHRWQPEVSILHARTVVSPRFSN